jgi:hypothetical protein
MTSISVSDFAGAYDQALGYNAVPEPGVAGATDGVVVSNEVYVSDVAGQVDYADVPDVTNIRFEDYAAGVDGIYNQPKGALVKEIEISVNSYQGVYSTLASSCAAGVPYQGNMRSLNRDHWNFMYPS